MATDEVKVRLRVELATVTEREAVLRERAAFENGVNSMFIENAVPATSETSEACSRLEAEAATRYPLPKVTRARVLKNDTVFGSAYEFTVIDGTIKERLYGGSWKTPSGWLLTADVVDAWADLLANPTEEVKA